jgi:hypothetical protein
MNKAVELSDSLERFKHVIAFTVAGLHLCTGQLKPFNPILGETLQVSFKDGTKVFSEHISHHPPIASLLVEHPEMKYRMYGSVTFTAKMGANSLNAGQEGNQYVEFMDTKQKIVFTLPKYTLGGTVMGDRTINID